MDDITFLAVVVCILTLAIAYKQIDLHIKFTSIELKVTADRKDEKAEKKEGPDHESDPSNR
ncbi:hypothetical protein [Brevibacillus brevis]|uniref:YtzI protein n=1 Tax=Brevibacillus brevis TaxID=1393 RepID=A0ABY9TD67_BREBE|nr:hypothetical protein [Brevibacillus brevis]WNC17928.1 hypothetical protein RGB73_30195 [Brevibacillus brevis]